MATAATLNIHIVTSGMAAANGGLTNLTRTGGFAEAQAVRTTRAFGGLTGAIVALGAALAIGKLVQYSDTWSQMQGRLSLVTRSHEEMIVVQERLYQVSQRSRVGLEGISQLYTRLAQNTKELALTQGQMVRITETVSKALIIGGAAASEVRGGVLQLSQALASGTLRGDEFRSVLENMPRVVIALTDKLGVTRDELYKMAFAGKLTSRVLAQSLLEASREIDAEFSKLPLTVDGAMVIAHNSLLRYVGAVNQTAGATKTLANTITGLMAELEKPEAIAAGVEFAEALAEAFRQVANAAIWMGENLSLVIGIIKTLLALKILSFLRDVTLSIRAMGAAVMANPVLGLVAALVAVGVAIYELSDGFEHLELVGSRIDEKIGKAIDIVQTKLNATFGADSVLGSANLTRMADDVKSFLDRISGGGVVDVDETAARQMRILSREQDKTATDYGSTLNDFDNTGTQLMGLVGTKGIDLTDLQAFLTKVDEIQKAINEGDPTAWIAMNDQINIMAERFGDTSDEAGILLKQLADLDAKLTALHHRQVEIDLVINQRDLVNKSLNELPLNPYGEVPPVTPGEIAWGSTNFPIPPTPIDTLIRGKGAPPTDKAKKDPYPEAKRQIMDLLKEQTRLSDAYQIGAGAVAQAERATERYNAVSDLQAKKITPAQRTELTALINKTYDLKDANVAAATAMEARQEIERSTEKANLELSMMGSTTPELNTEIRLLELKNRLIDQGEPNAAVIAEGFRASIAGNEKVLALLERQKAASAAIAGIFDQAFQRIGSAITEAFTKGEAAAIDFQTVVDGVLSEMLQSLIQFGILNPLKNAVFGTNDPTTEDLGGMVSRLINGTEKPTPAVAETPATGVVAAVAAAPALPVMPETITSATLSIGAATVNMEGVVGSTIPSRPDIAGGAGVDVAPGAVANDNLKTAAATITTNASTFSDTFGGVLGRLANGMAGSSNIFISGFGSVLQFVLQAVQSAANAISGGPGGGSGAGFLGSIGKFIGSLFGGGAVASPGVGAPGTGGSMAAAYHSGGIVGLPSRMRSVSMSGLAGLPYFHQGGVAGDEVLGILRKGEEVLTQNNPRHSRNMGQAANSQSATPVVNNFKVENNSGGQVTQRETPNATGGVDIVAIIGRAAASELGRRGSPMAKGLQQTWGASPALRGR